MSSIWQEYNIQIVSGIISFVVATLTTFITYFMGKFRLRSAERVKLVSALTNEKLQAIDDIRKKIIVLKEYEDLSITENDRELYAFIHNNNFDSYSPSCCYSYKRLHKFSSDLNDLHASYGHCLRHSCVINLVYIRNILSDYEWKCGSSGLVDEELRFVSIPLYPELKKWHAILEKDLIRSLNRPTFKYYIHSGLVYKIMLKVYGIFYYKSETVKYMNDRNSTLNVVIDYKNQLKKEQQKERCFTN